MGLLAMLRKYALLHLLRTVRARGLEANVFEEIPEGRQHVHAHLHLKLILTPFLQELFRRVAYQTCYRKKIQGMSKQYPNALPMACGLCTKS